jgi:hypothetical protein
MGQKTYDPQTAKFIATVVQNMPDVNDMQRWIEDPKSLRAALSSTFCSNGKASTTTHLIDLDAAAKPYNGWQPVEHQKGGQFEWDPAKVTLYLDSGQKGGKWIKGEKLQQNLASSGKVPFNANLLDYLLEHPELIPTEWKQDENGNTRFIFFHGTTYNDSDGDRCVRCLCWDDGRWRTAGTRSTRPQSVQVRPLFFGPYT